MALEHLELWLVVGPLPSSQTADASKTPSLLVLSDLLGERVAMRTVLHLVLTGVDALTQQRRDTGLSLFCNRNAIANFMISTPYALRSEYGAAKEGAVLAALRLLRVALELDQAAVAVLRSSDQRGAEH